MPVQLAHHDIQFALTFKPELPREFTRHLDKAAVLTGNPVNGFEAGFMAVGILERQRRLSAARYSG